MENSNIQIKSTTRDIFLHLLHTIMLIVSVVGFLGLLFGYISVLFPDQLNPYITDYLDQIRLASSVLLVVFPIYILISWILGKDFKNDQTRRNIRARRIFMYLTLFAAAITVISDLITLIYRFYSGDYTVQFILKILSVLVVAAAVFGYYFWDIRRQNFESKKPKLIGWVSSVIVLVVIIAGFFIVGSPASQRDRRFDETRINDLQSIQSEIFIYWINKSKLPTSLNDLNNNISGYIPPIDPQSMADYEYKVKGTLVFELCADFKTDGNYYSRGSLPQSVIDRSYNQNWDHGVGKTCFSRTIDPELYKNQLPPKTYPL